MNFLKHKSKKKAYTLNDLKLDTIFSTDRYTLKESSYGVQIYFIFMVILVTCKIS